ncbi:MAG TPA: carboxypeptidase-like regulatory domain-containing protein [Blastocatellia bacterium]
MPILSRFLGSTALLIVFSFTAFGRSNSSTPDAASGTGGQISGTVSVDGKPAPGIQLCLITSDDPSRPLGLMFNMPGEKQVNATALTDSQGHYAFHGLSPTNYIVYPFSPTLAPPPVLPGMNTPGQVLNVQQDETIDGVDFSLSQGGVITGKVTWADGRPAIQVSLSIQPPDKPGFTVDMATGKSFRPISTDDRGIYRAYGLAPGKYTVCAQPRRTSGYALNPTFCYPGGADKTRSKVIEVGGGDEVANIDIGIGPASTGYNASGRAVDDNGNPVPGVQYYYYGVSDDGRPGGGMLFGTGTGPNGEFQITGLVPGHYGVTLKFDSGSGSYCDPAIFQISDGDVSNIQVKVHTVSTISGIVTVEGTQDPGVLAQLPNVQLQMFSHNPNTSPMMSYMSVNPAPDGSFQASGISPGQLNISLDRLASPPNFSLLRIEQNGTVQEQGIPVTAGQQVTDVQVVLSYGTGSIRGLVTVGGAIPPPGSQMIVSAGWVSGGSPGPAKAAVADARGRFEIDGLSDGQYQMDVGIRTLSGYSHQTAQVVTVNAGQPTDVTVTVDTSKQN